MQILSWADHLGKDHPRCSNQKSSNRAISFGAATSLSSAEARISEVAIPLKATNWMECGSSNACMTKSKQIGMFGGLNV
jgi:hypothetical protein